VYLLKVLEKEDDWKVTIPIGAELQKMYVVGMYCILGFSLFALR